MIEPLQDLIRGTPWPIGFRPSFCSFYRCSTYSLDNNAQTIPVLIMNVDMPLSICDCLRLLIIDGDV